MAHSPGRAAASHHPHRPCSQVAQGQLVVVEAAVGSAQLSKARSSPKAGSGDRPAAILVG